MVNNDQAYQHKNTLLINAIVIFVAVVAAVVTSAVIVTSMIKGEVAKAVSANPATSTQQTINPAYNVVPAGGCSDPVSNSKGGGSDVGVAKLNGKHYSLPYGLKNSFNKDSYNKKTEIEIEVEIENTKNINSNNYTKNSNNVVAVTKYEDNDGVDVLENRTNHTKK
jgi:hypothetical protein